MAQQTVYVVDDDADVRDSLQWLLTSVGLQVRTFGNAQDFLDAFEHGSSGCVVLLILMAPLKRWRYLVVCRLIPRCKHFAAVLISLFFHALIN